MTYPYNVYKTIPVYELFQMTNIKSNISNLLTHSAVSQASQYPLPVSLEWLSISPLREKFLLKCSFYLLRWIY